MAAMAVDTRLRPRLRRARRWPTLLFTSTFPVRYSIFKKAANIFVRLDFIFDEYAFMDYIITGRKLKSGGKCSVYIGDEVIGILNADGQPQKTVADTQFGPFCRRYFLM